ncbi:MAG: ATP-binding protein [Pleurocapsa sp. MO_192.B19]|nr:ATP-binding protein [Pleurocapsa sp. MO_192.B19]
MIEKEFNKIRDAIHQVPLFSKLTDEQLAFVKQGESLWLQSGDILTEEGKPAGSFFVQLEGKLEWTKKIRNQDIHVTYSTSNDFFGHKCLLLDIPYSTTKRAICTSHILKFSENIFWRMIATCPSLTPDLLYTMAQRVQNLEAIKQYQATLTSLSTLAAGLAHELNNPAAAAQRAVVQLRDEIYNSQSLSLKFLKQPPSSLQWLVLKEIWRDARDKAMSFQKATSILSSLDKKARYEELKNWLDIRGVKDAAKRSLSLIDAGLDPKWLITLVKQMPTEIIGNLLLWLETMYSIENLLDKSEKCTLHITELVKAFKEYSYMDQAPQQKVDVHKGLEKTLIILAYKLRQNKIMVTRRYDKSLPRIWVYGSELNQVWTNLIDNAIAALANNADETRQISIYTSQENCYLLVEIADNGTSIRPKFQTDIFESIQNRKISDWKVDLDLLKSYRIVVGRHKGKISVDSKPGNTRFQVRLPIAIR